MKLLVVTNHFYPENFRINDLVDGLVERGFEVDVVTQIPNYPKGCFFEGYGFFKKRKEKLKGVNIHRIWVIPRGKSLVGLALNYASMVLSGWFFRLFLRKKYDRILCFQTSPVMVGWISRGLAKKQKIPATIYIQDLWPDSFFSIVGSSLSFLQKPLQKMSQAIYQGHSHLLVVSKELIPSLKQMGIERPISYFPQYALEEPDQAISQDFGFGFHVTFTGNVGLAQGLEVLVEAAQYLEPGVIFHIIGDGRNLASLKEAVVEKGVEPFFDFIDPVNHNHLAGYLMASHLALVILKPDPLLDRMVPAKVQTYLALGCPILSVAGKACANLVREADCGLAARYSAKDICRAINHVQSLGPDRLEEMRNKSLAYSHTHFNRSQLLDQLSQWLKEDTYGI